MIERSAPFLHCCCGAKPALAGSWFLGFESGWDPSGGSSGLDEAYVQKAFGLICDILEMGQGHNSPAIDLV